MISILTETINRACISRRIHLIEVAILLERQQHPRMTHPTMNSLCIRVFQERSREQINMVFPHLNQNTENRS